jgi:hypothetical protein
MPAAVDHDIKSVNGDSKEIFIGREAATRAEKSVASCVAFLTIWLRPMNMA